MPKISEQFKRNPMLLGAVVIVGIVFGFGAYSALSRKDETGRKPVAVTAPASSQATTAVVVRTDEEGKKVAQQLPSTQLAQAQQRDALQNQGRYASPIGEPPSVVKPKQIVVQRTEPQEKPIEKKNPKEDETRRLFEKYSKLEPKEGGFMKQASFKEEENGNRLNEPLPKPPFEIPYYVFVKGTVETGFNSLNTDVPVVISLNDGRFPAGTKVVGAAKANIDAGRMNTELKQIRMPSGAKYKLSGLAYSIDETPGIASKIERRDITGAVISTLFAGIRGFANAFSRDTTTTVINPWGGGTVIEEHDATNRAREAMLGAGREGAAKAESLVDRELQKDAFKTVVFAEKGLPVLVMFTQE